MAIDKEAPRSRRALLGAALGATGALVAGALGRPDAVRAGTDGDVVLGGNNDANSTTRVTATGQHAIEGRTNSGDGLRGWSDGANSSGVFGYSSVATGYGVYGKNTGRGVAALGTYNAALWASTAGWAAPLALKIEGPAQFSRSGRVTVAKGRRSKVLPVTATTATFGIGTVQQLRTDLYVQCVVRSGASLILYLNRAAPRDTSVAWIAFERP
jgi:hypothetical protein